MFSRIHLSDYRSYPSFSLSLSSKTNVIIGANGSGKTNILEAVMMLGQGKSFRGSDIAVIRYGKDKTKITAEEAGFERSLKLELQPDDKVAKTFLIEGKKYQRLSFQKTTAMVLFEPNFMQLISRGPDMRRDYFDSVLSRCEASYQPLLNSYRRTLAQRNSLLKQPAGAIDQLFAWDIKLAELAGGIVAGRLRHIEQLNSQLGRIYSQISDSPHTVEVGYSGTVNIQDYVNNLTGGLQKNIAKDRERGFTSLGPHREDFTFFINGKAAVTSASRGESRTLLLALKISEARLLETARGQKPILLLDDVFSELDETRQTKLVEYFKDNQVIITTTTITPLIKGISGKIIEL